MKISKQKSCVPQLLVCSIRSKLLIPVILTPLLFACTASDDKQANNINLSLNHGLIGYSGGFVPNGSTHDAMTGAPGASNNKGALLIYHEKSAGNISYLEGEATGDWFGSSFASLGDITGSGKQYFAVGAQFATGNAPLSGAVYVYEHSSDNDKLVAKLQGENAFDKFGYAMTSGDLNNDGRQDIIVSAIYTYTEAGYQSGAVYVYFGAETLHETPDVIISGDKVNANIGLSVATGDINNDNIADLLISASPKVFVYYGGSDFATRLAASLIPNTKFSGTSSSTAKDGSGFGTAITYLDDVNGDGIGDIAISSPNRSIPSTYDNVGSVYVFKGATDLPAEVQENDLNYRLTKIIGCSLSDRFGSALAYAGGSSKDLLVGTRWSLHPDSIHMVTGNIYRFPLATLIADNTQTYSVANSSAAYPQIVDDADGEYGRSIAVAGNNILAGAPRLGSETGGFYLIDMNKGVTPVCGGFNAIDGGGDHVH